MSAPREVRDIVDRAIRAATEPGREGTPAARLAAALTVVQLAQQQAYRFVVDLRGEGTSWRKAADLLNIPWSDEYSRAERAYELVLGPEPEGSSVFYTRSVYWHCGGPLGCGKYITDHGPYNGHPIDTEDGHAGGCRRLAAEITAHEREQELREQRDQVADEAMARITDPFARETVHRARWVLAHGGQYGPWSTSETLAVALILRDNEEMKRQGYSSRPAAVERVLRNDSPKSAEEWLALVRAAATGETN